MSERGFEVTGSNQLLVGNQLVSELGGFSPHDTDVLLVGEMRVGFPDSGQIYTYYPPLSGAEYPYIPGYMPPGWGFGGGAIATTNPVWERWVDFTPFVATTYGPIIAGVAQYLETPAEIDQTLTSYVCVHHEGTNPEWITYPPSPSVDRTFYLCDVLPWDESGILTEYPPAERGIDPLGVLMTEISTDGYAGPFQVYNISESDQLEVSDHCITADRGFIKDVSYPPKPPIEFQYIPCLKQTSLEISYGELYTRLLWPTGLDSLAISDPGMAPDQDDPFLYTESLATDKPCVGFVFPNPISWYIYPPKSAVALTYTYCYTPPRENTVRDVGAIIAEAEFSAPPFYTETIIMEPSYSQTEYAGIAMDPPVIWVYPLDSTETYGFAVTTDVPTRTPDIPFYTAGLVSVGWPWVWSDIQYIGPGGSNNAGYGGLDEEGNILPDPDKGPGTGTGEPEMPYGWGGNTPSTEYGSGTFDQDGGSGGYGPPDFEQFPPIGFPVDEYEATEYGSDKPPHVTYKTQFNYSAGFDFLEVGEGTLGTDQFTQPRSFGSLILFDNSVIRWLTVYMSSGDEQTEYSDLNIVSWLPIKQGMLQSFTEYGEYSNFENQHTAFGTLYYEATEFGVAEIHNDEQNVVFSNNHLVQPQTIYPTRAAHVQNEHRHLWPAGLLSMDTGEFDGYYPTVTAPMKVAHTVFVESLETEELRVSNWEMYVPTPYDRVLQTGFGTPRVEHCCIVATPEGALMTEYPLISERTWVSYAERDIWPYNNDMTEYGLFTVGTEQFISMQYYPYRPFTTQYQGLKRVSHDPQAADIPMYWQDEVIEYKPWVKDGTNRLLIKSIEPQTLYSTHMVENRDLFPEIWPDDMTETEVPTVHNDESVIAFEVETTTIYGPVGTIQQRDLSVTPGNLTVFTETYHHIVENELHIHIPFTQIIYVPNYGRYDSSGNLIVDPPETEYGAIAWGLVVIDVDEEDTLDTGKPVVTGGGIGMYEGANYLVPGNPAVEHEHRTITMFPRYSGEKPDEDTEALDPAEYGQYTTNPQFIFVCSDRPMLNQDEICSDDSGGVSYHRAYEITLQHRQIYPASIAPPYTDESSPKEDWHDLVLRGGRNFIAVEYKTRTRYGNLTIYPYPQYTYVTGVDMHGASEDTLVENAGPPPITDRGIDFSFLDSFEYEDVIEENFHRDFQFGGSDEFEFDKWIYSYKQFAEFSLYDAAEYPEDTYVSGDPLIRNVEEYDTLLTKWTRWAWRMNVIQKPQHLYPYGHSQTRMGITRMTQEEPA